MLYEKRKIMCSSSQPLEEVNGSRWRICALTAGKSENDAYYPEEVLKNDFQGLEGCNSYIYRLDEGAGMVFDHLPQEFLTPFDAPLMGHLIGWFSNPQIEILDEKTAITAELYIHRSAQPARNFFLDCWEHGKEIGFSITALTAYSNRMFDGTPVHWIEKMWFISCDPVSYPAVKGARALKLLESIKKEARKEMDGKVLECLFQIGQKIAPELKATGKTREASIAFCSHLIETLTECFPDSAIKGRLISLREALEKEDDTEAQKILELVSSDFEVGKTLYAKVEKLRASLEAGQKTQIREAYQLCLADMEKIDDQAMMEKLLSLKTLLDSEEWEAAKEYVAGLIDLFAPETPAEVYPEPAEVVPELAPVTVEPTPAEAYPLPPIVEDIALEMPSIEIKKGSEPELETPGVRVSRIELESILKSSGLPEAAREKISKSFANAETSRESIQQAVEQENNYLTSLGVFLSGQETDVEKAVKKAVNEVKVAFEKDKKAVNQAVNEMKMAFEKELTTFRESAENAKTEMSLFQESVSKTKTQEMVRRLIQESFLPAVCARRIEAMFADKVATEEEVKTAIKAESALTSEVIASIASTVKGFGDSAPVTDEETARAYVESFFDARL